MIVSPASPDNQAIRELRDGIIELNKTTGRANNIMIALTFVLVVLTIILIIYASIQVSPILAEKQYWRRRYGEFCAEPRETRGTWIIGGEKVSCGDE